MKTIQILGTGCAKCTRLAEVAALAASQMGQPYQLVKITDITQIMAFGVMATPALVVDGQVKAVGKVPGLDEMKKLLG